MKSLRAQIEKLHAEFKDHFIERDDEILGAILAILANENVLYLGPPGTAKTYLARNICRSIEGGNFFYYLLTRFTTPEEIFGPLSIMSLEHDQFKRKTDGCLPAAHIALLDEIFKANSSILNSLLTILNERRFHNGTEIIETPLLSVFGASNELPEEDENLEALYDRFLFRYDVRYIRNEENVRTLLFRNDPEFSPSVKLSVSGIKKLREQAGAVEIPWDVQEIILSLKKHLEQVDAEDCDRSFISDRRWKKAMDVLRVAAAGNGDVKVNRTMLLLLQHMLWDVPEQKEMVRRLIMWRIVTGGTDFTELEREMDDLLEVIHGEKEILHNEKLPVPVYSHTYSGENTKHRTCQSLIDATKNGTCSYFTIETSYSTPYPFSEVMEILQKKFMFDPEKGLVAKEKSACETEYARLEQIYHINEKNVRATVDNMDAELDANIWLSSHDIAEVSQIQQESQIRLGTLEEKMHALQNAIRS